MFVLNNTKELKPGKTWIDGNGIQHPGNWASVWSDDVKTSYGIKEITMQSKPDNKFYWVSGPALDGSWTSIPRNLDDVNEVDDEGNARLNEDGNQLVTKGLKSQWIVKTKQTANTLLAPTDWQVIAKAERDRAIDSNVATYRAAVITACTAIEKAITDITYPEAPSDYAAAKEKLEDDRTDAEKKIVSDHDTEVAAVFPSFKALFDVPVDSDGKPTGNAPMYDWPDSI
jgi:hypothetical protein